MQNAAGLRRLRAGALQPPRGRHEGLGRADRPRAGRCAAQSREIDLLNVRYLVSMRPRRATARHDARASDAFIDDATPRTRAATPAQRLSRARRRSYGDFMFAANDLGLPNLGAGKRLRFNVAARRGRPRRARHEPLVVGGRARRRDRRARAPAARATGASFDFELRAGADTAEWAHDRADIRARIRHTRAAVATSYAVEDAQGRLRGAHLRRLLRAARARRDHGRRDRRSSRHAEVARPSARRLPRLARRHGRGQAYPLRREWLSVERARPSRPRGRES